MTLAAKPLTIAAIMAKAHLIEARLACRIVEELKRRRESVDELLKEVGLKRNDVSDPEARIPYAALLALIERAATALGDASLGLRLGASQDARDSGLLGFVALNSPTLFDALSNLQRYFHVVGEGEDVELLRSGPHVAIRFRETDRALRGLRHNSDFLAAILVRLCRDLSRTRIAPIRAEFIHARPNQRVEYSEYLGCPVKFHAAWDALIFKVEDMQLKVKNSDDKLLRVLEQACRQVRGPIRKAPDIVYSVRELIVDRLAKGTASFDAIAAELNMSAKTLERRLTERKTSFSKLLEEIRCDFAKRFLTETDLRLEQIAFEIGYTESAVLVRAFKRWTRMTPIRFRERHR